MLDRRDILNLGKIPMLRKLELSSCTIDTDAFAALGRTRIERLVLVGELKQFFDYDWSALSNTKELCLQYDSETDLEPHSLEFLRRLTKLELLQLGYSSDSYASFAPVYQLHGLRKLDLSWIYLEDEKLVGLESLQNLEWLTLSGNLDLTQNSFSRLSHLQKLRRLEVAQTTFDDEGLAAIRQLPQLKVLDLTYTEVTAHGIAKIGLPPSLERLNLTRDFGPDGDEPIASSPVRNDTMRSTWQARPIA